jgi:hypothetical protein
MRKLKIILRVSLSLALLLPLSSAAAGTGFAFRGGINWGTTVAEMMAAEGLQDGGGAYNSVPYGGYTNFYLKTQNVYYVFRDDLLVMAYALLPGGADAYAAQKEQQAAVYGAPADISPDTFNTLMNLMFPGAYFAELTTWRLDDGTLVALVTTNGENYLIYINEQRIPDGA